ncbi:MAG: hypothetical protein AAGG01_18800, partial [Planctomycetota bacterium]
GRPSVSTWSGRPRIVTGAPVVAEDPPRAELVDSAGDLISFRVFPGRDCDQLGLSLPGALRLVIDGVTIPGPMAMILAPPDEGVLVAFERFSVEDADVAIDMVSQRFGLRGVRGRMADGYLGARPVEYVPFGHGDGSAVIGRTVLIPQGSEASGGGGE